MKEYLVFSDTSSQLRVGKALPEKFKAPKIKGPKLAVIINGEKKYYISYLTYTKKNDGWILFAKGDPFPTGMLKIRYEY